MSKIVLLGLPGLYQNWLMSAVDPNSKMQLHGDQNFFCAQSQVKWLIKTGLVDYPTASDDLTVLNLYVKEKNFPWYMYNLFEKTYDIRVMIDSFTTDIVEKGDKFVIFHDTKNDLLAGYAAINQNTVIHYFYNLFCENQHYLHTATQKIDPAYINIEFDDFTDPDILKNKLQSVSIFDTAHFDLLYTVLVNRNQRYLNKKKEFLQKLEQAEQSYDIIETAYIGALASQVFDGKRLNWMNESVRNSIIKHRIKEISDLAKELC